VSLGPAHPDTLWPIAGLGSGYLETTAIQIRDFVNAIVTGSPARPNFADGARVQQVIDAVIASSNAQAWIVVPAALAVVR
jgi:predicted dehydrogenase